MRMWNVVCEYRRSGSGHGPQVTVRSDFGGWGYFSGNSTRYPSFRNFAKFQGTVTIGYANLNTLQCKSGSSL